MTVVAQGRHLRAGAPGKRGRGSALQASLCYAVTVLRHGRHTLVRSDASESAPSLWCKVTALTQKRHIGCRFGPLPPVCVPLSSVWSIPFRLRAMLITSLPHAVRANMLAALPSCWVLECVDQVCCEFHEVHVPAAAAARAINLGLQLPAFVREGYAAPPGPSGSVSLTQRERTLDSKFCLCIKA